MPEPEDVQFECHACHKDCKSGAEGVMTECRLCGRLHCSDCVDEYGRCVECSSKPSPEK
jgi:hypothetical protein